VEWNSLLVERSLIKIHIGTFKKIRKVVAIGECGLDYYIWMRIYREAEKSLYWTNRIGE